MIEPPPHQQHQGNPAGDPDDGAQEELGRNVPSELRSRPKILRTPADGQRPNRDQDMPQHDQLNEPLVPVKIKGELVNDEGQLKEHGEGFVTREKIARTPPEDKVRGPQQRPAPQYGPEAPNIHAYYADPDGLEQRKKAALAQYGGGSQGQGQAVSQIDALPLHQQYIYQQQRQSVQGPIGASQPGSPGEPSGAPGGGGFGYGSGKAPRGIVMEKRPGY